MTLDFLPANHLSPGTAYKFSWTPNHQGLVALPQSIALVGIQSLAVAAADEPVPVPSPDDAAALFGPGSELALMVDAAFATGSIFGQMPVVYAVPLAPPAGAATVTQIALAGTVTRSGRALVRIAGVAVEAFAMATQTAADLAQSLRDAMAAATRQLPVAPGGADATLLATHRTTGSCGNEVAFEIVELPQGIAATVTRTTEGAGTADISAALDHLLALDVNAIALAEHTPVAVQAASDHAAVAWQPTRKRWRHMFIAETGDTSAAGALAAIDTYSVIIAACKGSPSLTGQISAALACIAFATGSPNYNLSEYSELPLFAPRPADRYTPLDTEEILQLGATPLVAVDARTDRLAITRLATAQRTLSGARTLQLVDASVSLTAAYMARQLDQAYRRSFGTQSDSPRLVDDELLGQVRDVIVATLRAAEKAGYIRHLDQRLGEIAVRESQDTPGRLLAAVPIEPTPQLLQLAFSMNVLS